MISYRTRFRERLFRQFAEFSAVAADCAKPEDKERLLGVIELGFGGFHDFDALVRDVLLQRVAAEIDDTTESDSKLAVDAANDFTERTSELAESSRARQSALTEASRSTVGRPSAQTEASRSSVATTARPSEASTSVTSNSISIEFSTLRASERMSAAPAAAPPV